MNSPEITRDRLADHASFGLLGYLRNECRELKGFVFKPTRRRTVAASKSKTFRRIMFLLLLALLFAGAISSPLNWALERWAGIVAIDRHGIGFLIGAIGLAPVVEEFLFRAGLRSAKYTLFIGPPLIGLLLGSFSFAIAFGIFLTVIGVTDAGLMKRAEQRGEAGRKFARGRRFIHLFPLIFWLYAIAFAFAHIANFQFFGWSGALAIFAVTAQFFLGVMLGYLRLRHGLGSAMLLHALFNLMVLGLFQLVWI